MHKCQNCKTEMEFKGEVSEDGSTGFYQCPKCKNIELHTVCSDRGLRMTYP